MTSFYCSYFVNEEAEALRGQVRSGRVTYRVTELVKDGVRV